MRKLFLVVMALSMVALWAIFAQADLITNGSFEDGNYSPTYPGYDFMTLSYDSGQNKIHNWTVTAVTVVYS